MQSVGAYAGDGTEHAMLPLTINTLCGMGISMDSIIDSNGYYRQALPMPMEYAVPCPKCQERIFRLEDLLNDLCQVME